MKPIFSNHTNPVYRTKREVFIAAQQNAEFFDSFSDALRNCWKFYQR